MKECLGAYENKQGQCDSCPLVLLCIEASIAADKYYDELADRQEEIKEMEADVHWTQRTMFTS